MRTNEIVLVVAVVFLGLFMLAPWTDAQQKAVALGALAGLVGGHLNGRANVASVRTETH